MDEQQARPPVQLEASIDEWLKAMRPFGARPKGGIIRVGCFPSPGPSPWRERESFAAWSGIGSLGTLARAL